MLDILKVLVEGAARVAFEVFSLVLIPLPVLFGLFSDCRGDGVGERLDPWVQLHQVLNVWRVVTDLLRRGLQNVTFVGDRWHLGLLAGTAVQKPNVMQGITQ